MTTDTDILSSLSDAQRRKYRTIIAAMTREEKDALVGLNGDTGLSLTLQARGLLEFDDDHEALAVTHDGVIVRALIQEQAA